MIQQAKGKKYMYGELTWLEMKEAVAQQRVILLPVGTIENHGHHLFLETDNFLVTNVCRATAERIPEEVLIMPLVPYGFNWHHIDFPGTIGIAAEHFIDYCLDITKSVAYHGFRKILIVDGHGSNVPFLDIVARRTVMETEALCASFIYTSLVGDFLKEVRESSFPGGMAHADELETSLTLHLEKERANMSLAKKEIGMLPSQFIWHDLGSSSPVAMMEWWSTFSQTGVLGDPTVATEEKGEAIFKKVIERMVELVKEFKARPIRPRRDQH
jgi:creatinine amidohydrolase